MQRILSNISQVVGPSPEEIAALQNILRPRSLVKGEHFLREGEICRSIAFVEKGSFRVYYAVDGKDIHKDFLFENGIIGSFASFFAQSPSALYITALEDSHILELTYQEVMHLYECYPSWQKLGRIIAQDQFVRAETREASLLKDTPLVRYQALLEAHPKVFRRVPLQYIASYLGITPETLSRYRSKTNA
jgi:CRP-like cAMP-binding protein